MGSSADDKLLIALNCAVLPGAATFTRHDLLISHCSAYYRHAGQIRVLTPKDPGRCMRCKMYTQSCSAACNYEVVIALVV